MSDLNLLFNPRSIAIIGASNHLLKWGFLVLHNVMRGGYKGRLYPINKKEDKVFGIPAYPDIKSVGDDIDVAAIIIPARSVPEVIEECGESGVKFILTYNESGKGGKEFMKVGEEVTARKPIVAYKAGVTEMGKKTSASHVGGMVVSKEVYNVAMKKAGVLMAKDSEEMVDMAGAFSCQPLPEGRRIGIITYGGGWGVLSADTCELNNLEIPKPPPEVFKELDAIMPSHWSKGNPVDTVGVLDASVFENRKKNKKDERG